jgi:hypothetical protein
MKQESSWCRLAYRAFLHEKNSPFLHPILLAPEQGEIIGGSIPTPHKNVRDPNRSVSAAPKWLKWARTLLLTMLAHALITP